VVARSSILDLMPPTPEQRRVILARGSDVAVTAGAGTGKTRTLVGRYLTLVEEGLPLESILAITFTLRAAREMRNRVRDQVRQYRELIGDGDPLWAQVYEGLNAARISTIHSLCAEILRRHPVEAGLDPRFDLLGEGHGALELERAVKAAMAWAADDPQASQLYDWYSDSALQGLLEQALSKRIDVVPALQGMREGCWPLWQRVLLEALGDLSEDQEVIWDMRRILDAPSDGSLARASAGGDGWASLVPQAIEAWNGLQQALQSDALSEAIPLLRAWREALSGSKGKASLWGKDGPLQARDRLRQRHDALLGPLLKGVTDADTDRLLAEEVLPQFTALVHHAVAHYGEAKRRANALDYDDLEELTLALLKSQPSVLHEWQGMASAILVDEFQDTNQRQRDLVLLLNGGRGRLFIVGDGKQSIYAFRGADVSVFRQERARMASSGLAVDLRTTYRTHPGLVAAQSALLGPVMGTESDPLRPWMEPFSPVMSARHNAAPGLHEPWVELLLAEESEDHLGAARAAQAVVERLEALMRQGITLESTDPETGERLTRPLDYGDVAVLCRAASGFVPFENALEAAGIPYHTISGRGFYDRPEVRDLLNTLRALADPTDDLALVGLLRSPAIGVDDMTLVNLRALQRDYQQPSLWSLLTAPLPDDPHRLAFEGPIAAATALPSSAAALARGRELVRRTTRMIGRLPAADVLKAWVDATHYRAILLRQGQERALRNVDKLLADATASGITSVNVLVDYVDTLRGAATREGEGRALASGAVQLMTIHQAKGLEFPVVVVGNLGHQSNRRQGLLLHPELGLVIPPPRKIGEDPAEPNADASASLACNLAIALQDAQDDAEADRLLYVAITRARELLILSGVARPARNGKLSLRGMLRRLDAAIDINLRVAELRRATTQANDSVEDPPSSHTQVATIPGWEGGAPVPLRMTLVGVGAPVAADVRRARRAAADAVAAPPEPAMLEPLTDRDESTDAKAQALAEDPPPRVWRVVPQATAHRAPAWVVGQIVHRALARWSFPDTDPGMRAWALAEARTCGLTAAPLQRDAAARASRLLTRFQSHPLYAEMMSAELRLGEVPYTLQREDGQAETGIIDALYRREGAWSLVEFKTDSLRTPEALRRLLHEQDYVPQVNRYLRACHALLPADPQGNPATVRPVLCFLDYMGRVYLVRHPWPTP
jgi:ATP-dependent helicase/nuclease subunit A